MALDLNYLILTFLICQTKKKEFLTRREKKKNGRTKCSKIVVYKPGNDKKIWFRLGHWGMGYLCPFFGKRIQIMQYYVHFRLR